MIKLHIIVLIITQYIHIMCIKLMFNMILIIAAVHSIFTLSFIFHNQASIGNNIDTNIFKNKNNHPNCTNSHEGINLFQNSINAIIGHNIDIKIPQKIHKIKKYFKKILNNKDNFQVSFFVANSVVIGNKNANNGHKIIL